MRRSPKLQCESGRPALGSSRPRLRTPASAGHPSQSSTGRDSGKGVVSGRSFAKSRLTLRVILRSPGLVASRCLDWHGSRPTLFICDGVASGRVGSTDPLAAMVFEVSYVPDDGAEHRVPIARGVGGAARAWHVRFAGSHPGRVSGISAGCGGQPLPAAMWGLSLGWNAIRCCIWTSTRPWSASRPSRSGCTGPMRRASRSRTRRTSSPAEAMARRWWSTAGRWSAAGRGTSRSSRRRRGPARWPGGSIGCSVRWMRW